MLTTSSVLVALVLDCGVSMEPTNTGGASAYMGSRRMALEKDEYVCVGPEWNCGSSLTFCDAGPSENGFGCICDVDIDGNEACWNDDLCRNWPLTPCDSSDSCPDNQHCITGCCSRGYFCWPTCENPVDNAVKPDAPIEECDTDPCDCDDDEFCRICHYPDGPGCSQCEFGYFKLDWNYPCTNCQELFGPECNFCQDFHGCGQCSERAVRMEDEHFGIWYCADCDDLYGEGCQICQESGCGQCRPGYELVMDEDGVRVCLST